MAGPLFPRKVKAPSGHKCLGVAVKFETNCECGWYSCPHQDRAEAYSEWREHARSHGGEVESYEAYQKREASYLRKIGIADRSQTP